VKIMKKYIWMAFAAAIMMAPLFVTGCGADDTETDKQTGVYTIGPGNMETFETSGSIR
jgi:4-hydroxybenzoate polyprenyltransferase